MLRGALCRGLASLCAAFIFLVLPADTMIVKFPQQTLPPNMAPWIREVEVFHALAHATITFSFEIAPSTEYSAHSAAYNNSKVQMYLLGCQHDATLSQATLADLCRNDSAAVAVVAEQCSLVVPTPSQHWVELPSEDMISLSMLKCPSSTAVSIGGQLEVAQPDGLYLSAELRHYPLMYLILAVVWLPPTILWLVLHFKYAHAACVWQKYLWLLPTLKLSVMAFSCGHFWMCDQRGTKTNLLPYLVNTSKTAYLITFYGMIFLFSKGLLVTRAYLRYPEIRMAVLVVLGHSLASLVASSSSPYLWSFWLLTFMCLTVLIVSSSYRTTQHLRAVGAATCYLYIAGCIDC